MAMIGTILLASMFSSALAQDTPPIRASEGDDNGADRNAAQNQCMEKCPMEEINALARTTTKTCKGHYGAGGDEQTKVDETTEWCCKSCNCKDMQNDAEPCSGSSGSGSGSKMCPVLKTFLTCVANPSCDSFMKEMEANGATQKEMLWMYGCGEMTSGGGAETTGGTATTVTTTTTTRTVVEIGFEVKNVDLSDLNEADQDAMKLSFVASIATAAGVPADQVTVVLEQGSVKVTAQIETSDPAGVQAEMAKPEKVAMLKTAVKSNPQLKKAIEAKGMTVNDLEVSTPAVSTVTVTQAPSEEPALGDVSIAAPAQNAPGLAIMAAMIVLLA